MIFITVAMFSEAKPLVQCLELKRMAEETKYQIFTNNEIFLILTGVGGTKAMMATMYLLTRFHAKKSDFLLSVGLAALVDPCMEFGRLRGRIYLARKIENIAFHRTSYPDLLYRTPFPEADILTRPFVYRKGENDPATFSDTPVLADMEACFVFEAAASFLYAHHIFVLKIISDDGDCSGITRQAIEDLVGSHTGEIQSFLHRLGEEGTHSGSADGNGMKPADQILLDKIKQLLRLSLYQRNEIQKLAESHVCRKNTIAPLLENLAEGEGVKTKKEGKDRYEQFRKLLTEP